MKLNPRQVLFAQGGLGRLHRVTAVFTDTASANARLASTPGEAVLVIFDSFVFVAAVSDLGVPILPIIYP